MRRMIILRFTNLN
jgi:hypothetical protein